MNFNLNERICCTFPFFLCTPILGLGLGIYADSDGSQSDTDSETDQDGAADSDDESERELKVSQHSNKITNIEMSDK